MAAGATYFPLATTTIASAAASYTFTSIPQTYTDLEIVFSGSGTAAGNVVLQYNNDSGSNYSFTELYGDGSSAASARNSSAQTYARVGSVNTNQSTAIAAIMNYSNTTTYKTSLGKAASTSYVDNYVSLWRGSTGSATQAITSITVLVSGTTIAAGTTITLYGIAAA